jgi:Domain of unknown function (DUF6438)
MKPALALIAAVALSACATPPSAPASQSTVMIRLLETPCYFRCPSYEIELRSDGSYRYLGRENALVQGEREGKLAPDAWSRAQAALARARFDAMPEEALPADHGRAGAAPCIHDLPSAEFTRRSADGAEKKVRYNTGCNVPEARALLDDLRAVFPFEDLVRKP